MAQEQDPLTALLDKAPTSNKVRAAAWDAFEQSANEDELVTRLDKLALPQHVKAQLWDLKVSTAVKPPAAPAQPAQDATSPGTAAPVHPHARAAQIAGDVAIGVGKGAANTAIGLGELFYNYVPGVGALSDAINGQPAIEERSLSDLVTDKAPRNAFAGARQEFATPTNTAQNVGFHAEQIGEYFIPGAQAEKVAAAIATKVPSAVPKVLAKVLPRMATESATAAGVASAQGGDPATAAAFGATAPVVGRVIGATATAAGNKAEPLVRAAIKPTVSAMKKIAGASVTGIEAQADRLVRFIINNRVTTAAKANELIMQAERELQRVLSVKNAPTDAPQRALRYLEALERSASKQGLPAQDVATIRNAAAEVLESGLGKDVVTMVPQAHPTLVGPNGQPITVMAPQTTRALRTDVMADEALERARATSKWETRKAYGEQKGAQMESSKAIERAERDAVKAAVPEAKPLLEREGMGKQAREVLDRMEHRAANRDAVSLPAHVALANGKEVLAIASNWLRNNQLKAGIYADKLRTAIKRHDVQTAAAILQRLGVAGSSEATAQR